MTITSVLKSAINIVLSIIELFLGLRLVLKLFGASTGAPFVSWIYETSEPLLYPFRGMFASPVLEEGIVIEFSTMFAMIAYALVAWLFIELINFMSRTGRDDRNSTDDNETVEVTEKRTTKH